MLVFSKKTGDYLKKENKTWADLQRETGLSPSVMAKLQKDRPCNTDTINKVCEVLKRQPGDLMEWIPDEEYERQNAERLSIERQIAELQEKLKQL